jgi:hypothetical protein
VAYNAPITAGTWTSVSTGTSVKTMLQLATPSSRMLQVVSWGFSISGAQAGTVSLCAENAGDTVTAHVASGLMPMDGNLPASLLTLGTTATGYTASAQASPTTVRMFDSQLIAGTAGDNELNYSYQFLPDEQPVVNISSWLKIKASFSVAVNMQCYINWAE